MGSILSAGLAGLVGGAAVAAAVFLARPAGEHEPREASVVATSGPGFAELTAAIGKLDQRLAGMEAALAAQESRGAREPEAVHAATEPEGQSAPFVSAPQGLDELHKDLLQLSKRVDGLAESLKENGRLAYQLPTLAQIHAARRDVDWAFVDEVRQTAFNDRNAALARVRLMTFDDLLRKVGVPTVIAYSDGGRWAYARSRVDEHGQERQCGITMYFVGDCVTDVMGF